MCPVCNVQIKKKTVLYPSGAENNDYVATGLQKLNCLLFDANAEVEMNTTIGNMAGDQSAALVERFQTLHTNILQIGREFEVLEKEFELKDAELQTWKNKAKKLKSKMLRLKKGKKIGNKRIVHD